MTIHNKLSKLNVKHTAYRSNSKYILFHKHYSFEKYQKSYSIKFYDSLLNSHGEISVLANKLTYSNQPQNVLTKFAEVETTCYFYNLRLTPPQRNPVRVCDHFSMANRMYTNSGRNKNQCYINRKVFQIHTVLRTIKQNCSHVLTFIWSNIPQIMKMAHIE